MSILSQLAVPVIAAPMAGGPSIPRLVEAVARAGGLGFLAGGTLPAEKFVPQLGEVDPAAGAWGVNLFARQNPYHSLGQVREVARLLEPYFAERGLERPRVPEVDYDYGWDGKFAAVLDSARAGRGPAVVSCTFGRFTLEETAVLREVGIEAWVTVTHERDAVAAARAGADALVVQGPEAGGHRATWTVETLPDLRPLSALVAAVAEVTDLPLVAAGGLTTPRRVARALTWPGVAAVACGSAFLLSEEAGTSAANRQLLAAGEADTETTRAFSGRHARGLETAFTRAHRELPPSYPQLNMMLKPLRGEPEFAYCLAGENYRDAKSAPAGQIVAYLSGADGADRGAVDDGA